jgi:hypothetical protein
MNRSARAEVVDEVSRWSVGPVLLLTVLAPLAIPILVLTVVFIAPLLILPLVAALPVALVVGAVLAVRRSGGGWGAGPRAGVSGTTSDTRRSGCPRERRHLVAG